MLHAPLVSNLESARAVLRFACQPCLVVEADIARDRSNRCQFNPYMDMTEG
jgi:hypothetical protein